MAILTIGSLHALSAYNVGATSITVTNTINPLTNVLLAYCVTDDSANIVTASGWTSLGSIANSSGPDGQQRTLLHRVVTQSEPTSYVFNLANPTTDGLVVIHELVGVDPNPANINIQSFVDYNANKTAFYINSPNITTIVDTDVLLMYDLDLVSSSDTYQSIGIGSGGTGPGPSKVEGPIIHNGTWVNNTTIYLDNVSPMTGYSLSINYTLTSGPDLGTGFGGFIVTIPKTAVPQSICNTLADISNTGPWTSNVTGLSTGLYRDIHLAINSNYSNDGNSNTNITSFINTTSSGSTYTGQFSNNIYPLGANAKARFILNSYTGAGAIINIYQIFGSNVGSTTVSNIPTTPTTYDVAINPSLVISGPIYYSIQGV